MVPTEEPSKSTFGWEEVEPWLATVPNLTIEKMTAHLPPLSVARSLVSRGEVALELMTNGGSQCSISDIRGHRVLMRSSLLLHSSFLASHYP